MSSLINLTTLPFWLKKQQSVEFIFLVFMFVVREENTFSSCVNFGKIYSDRKLMGNHKNRSKYSRVMRTFVTTLASILIKICSTRVLEKKWNLYPVWKVLNPNSCQAFVFLNTGLIQAKHARCFENETSQQYVRREKIGQEKKRTRWGKKWVQVINWTTLWNDKWLYHSFPKMS